MTEHKVEHQANGTTYRITLSEREAEWSFHYISQNTIRGRSHPKPIVKHGFSNRREAEEAAHASISLNEQ